jgi:hypothetical protein
MATKDRNIFYLHGSTHIFFIKQRIFFVKIKVERFHFTLYRTSFIKFRNRKISLGINFWLRKKEVMMCRISRLKIICYQINVGFVPIFTVIG